MFSPMDLRKHNLGELGIVAVQTRKKASEIAVGRGFHQDDIRPAFNRFWEFWVIGWWAEYPTKFRFAAIDRGTVDVIL